VVASPLAALLRLVRGGSRTAAATLLGATLWLAAAPARAESALFTIAIGHNGVPAGVTEPGVTPLRYADDDAAAVHQLGRALSRRSFLLALPDAETVARFPDVAGQARAPALRELDRVLTEVNAAIAEATRAGDETSVVLFYSGHGTIREDGQGALTFLDGALTRDGLYDRVLAVLTAKYVHLLVDACHAESVVRPRDGQAQVVAISEVTASAYVGRATLARFPNVGAIVASVSAAQAHEWDAYRGGVFTHEVLSGLRGGADVNGDRLIEYSELAAFLSAANHAVTDPRGRLQTVVTPVAVNPRAPVLDLRAARGVARLQGKPSGLGAIYLEDGNGARLLDLRAEPDFGVQLLLPPMTLFLHTADREAELRLAENEKVAFADLTLRPRSTRPRGAIATSLQRGLFATRFGPAYYLGFMGHAPDMIPVDVAVADPGDAGPAARGTAHRWVLGGAGVLAASAGVFGGLALQARNDFNGTDISRDARAASDRYDRARFTAMGLAGAAVVAAGVGLWLWLRD
jgi:hypothetical protein